MPISYGAPAVCVRQGLDRRRMLRYSSVSYRTDGNFDLKGRFEGEAGCIVCRFGGAAFAGMAAEAASYGSGNAGYKDSEIRYEGTDS